MSNTTWLPPYIIRKSPRAKHLQLRITRYRGLEVIVPARLDLATVEVLSFLETKREWIERHSPLLVPNLPPQIPAQLDLLAINQVITVCQASEPLSAGFDPERTWLLSSLAPAQQVLQLKRKLIRHANAHLLPQLNHLATQHQFIYESALVRAQKTLWGSCSPKHHISLNFKLLFLPPGAARYVLLHELCHTRHLNHSKRFWRLLASLDPQYVQHEAYLKNAERFVPSCLQ